LFTFAKLHQPVPWPYSYIARFLKQVQFHRHCTTHLVFLRLFDAKTKELGTTVNTDIKNIYEGIGCKKLFINRNFNRKRCIAKVLTDSHNIHSDVKMTQTHRRDRVRTESSDIRYYANGGHAQYAANQGQIGEREHVNVNQGHAHVNQSHPSQSSGLPPQLPVHNALPPVGQQHQNATTVYSDDGGRVVEYAIDVNAQRQGQVGSGVGSSHHSQLHSQ